MSDNKIIFQRFKSSIKRGTGEAFLIMQKNPTVDFSSEIIKASLINYAYDGQVEGSRATYVFELIALSKQRDKIRKAILKGLASERQDAWALAQLFDLTAIYAKQGDEEALRAIYHNFYNNPIENSEWIGQDALIEVSGLEGLKYVAEVKGKVIANNPEEWEDRWTVDYFQKQNPKIKVYEALEKASKTSKNIKIYLEAIEKNKIKTSKREKLEYNYETVIERINNNVIVPLPLLFAKNLSRSDIKKLADDFLKETDRMKLEKYMGIFDCVKFPYHYQPLLALAKSARKKDGLVEYACKALKYFSGPDIRKFAIDRLSKVKLPAAYLDLLVSNYKKGDGRLLTGIISRCKSDHDVHILVSGYVNIYKANPTKECKKPLVAIYNKMTCGIHRQDIVKILIDNKVLSKQIRKEIKHDSYEGIRKLL